MQQMGTPFQHNSAVQMYPQQLMCQQRIQHQQIQLTQPDTVPIEVGDLPSQLDLSYLPGQSRLLDSSQQCRVNPDDAYCCYFLEQLQGSYEVEGVDNHYLEVQLFCRADLQYLIVRPSLKKQCVSDLYVYEEVTRFTLCSVDGSVIAVMPKGVSMKQCVTWYANDGTRIVWRRSGNISFSLVENTPNTSRRNSIVSNFSGYSSLGTTDGSVEMSADVYRRSRPEVYQPGRYLTEQMANSSPSSGDSSTSLPSESLSQEAGSPLEDDLLKTFQSHLRKDPSLLQRFLQWGISHIPNYRVGEAEVRKFGKGRVWVSASLDQQDSKNWSDVLDEIKGAYQEATPGVYLQTPRQENEPGLQHRLKRSRLGLWTIEEYVAEKEQWVMCTHELPYGGWVDSKDNLKMYNIRVVSMVSILSRMKDEWSHAYGMEKNLEFLFKSCNHKKLNTKLKARNLRHNVANLKLKLEKQHMLCFGISVANVADEIAFGFKGKDDCVAVRVL